MTTMPFYVPGPEGGMVPVDTLPAPSLVKEKRTARRLRWGEMIKAGVPVCDIAAQEMVDPNLVYQALRAIGVSVVHDNPQRKRAKIERANKVNELYRREGSLEGAAKVLGVTRERVRQILVAGGILDRRDRMLESVPTLEQVESAKADFDSGLSVEAIAQKNGISKLKASAWLHAAGINLIKCSGRRRRSIDYDQVRAEYEAGATSIELAAKYGKSVHTICYAITRAGGKLNAYRPAPAVKP